VSAHCSIRSASITSVALTGSPLTNRSLTLPVANGGIASESVPYKSNNRAVVVPLKGRRSGLFEFSDLPYPELHSNCDGKHRGFSLSCRAMLTSTWMLAVHPHLAECLFQEGVCNSIYAV
jgi:hypothetical protein